MISLPKFCNKLHYNKTVNKKYLPYMLIFKDLSTIYIKGTWILFYFLFSMEKSILYVKIAVSPKKFTPYYNNKNHNHDLRYRILRQPMTRHEYFVQCTKYQLLRLIRETPHIDLNRCTQLNIVQFSAYFKYSFINNYNPLCNLKHCHVCGWLSFILVA